MKWDQVGQVRHGIPTAHFLDITCYGSCDFFFHQLKHLFLAQIIIKYSDFFFLEVSDRMLDSGLSG